MAEPTVQVRKVSGLRLVDIPDGPRRVAVGDVVEVAKSRAVQLVAGGEFEAVNPTAGKPRKARAAKPATPVIEDAAASKEEDG